MPLRGDLLEDTSRSFSTESAHPPCLKRAQRGFQGWGQGGVKVLGVPSLWWLQGDGCVSQEIGEHNGRPAKLPDAWGDEPKEKNLRSQCNFDVLDQTAVFAKSHYGVDLQLCSFGITYKSPSRLKACLVQHVLMLGGLGETSSPQCRVLHLIHFVCGGFEALWFSKKNGAHVHNISHFNKQW